MSVAREESLERGSEENRLKRTVAHGSRIDANGTGSSAPREGELVTKAEERPRTKRSWFDPLVSRELFALAWPIAAAMLGETAIGVVDTKLVGGLGSAALGGVGLGAVLMYLAYSFSYGAMRGVKVRVAHAIGEGRPLDGFAYARAGLVMGGAFGVLVLVACRDVTPLLVLLGADREIVPFTREFLGAVTLGAPATCALAALIQHRQAIGDSRTTMVVGIGGNAFNALFAWALIYGHLGLPALGVRGGGYATATTEMLELAVMFFLFIRDERRALGASETKWTELAFPAALRDVADLGLPTGVQFVSETLAFTALTVVLGSIGKEQIAAHQIALNVIRISFLPGIAVSEATSVLVGRALGRRRLGDADATVRSGLAMAVAFMAGCGVVFALFGEMLGRFFTADPAVVASTRVLLLVAALFQVLDAVNIVLRGALRGAKDVRAVMLIGTLVVWTFLPTSAYVLGKTFGLGALGGWLGFVGETTVGALLFWLRWRRGGWRKDYA